MDSGGRCAYGNAWAATAACEQGMSWKRVCAAGEVAENTLRKFEVDGIAVIVAKIGDEYRAFPPLCPHMAEPLVESGIYEDGVLTCTKHLWQWNLRTGDMVGLAEKRLLMYEVKREGDDVLAYIERELAYEYHEEDEPDDDDFFSGD